MANKGKTYDGTEVHQAFTDVIDVLNRNKEVWEDNALMSNKVMKVLNHPDISMQQTADYLNNGYYGVGKWYQKSLTAELAEKIESKGDITDPTKIAEAAEKGAKRIAGDTWAPIAYSKGFRLPDEPLRFQVSENGDDDVGALYSRSYNTNSAPKDAQGLLAWVIKGLSGMIGGKEFAANHGNDIVGGVNSLIGGAKNLFGATDGAGRAIKGLGGFLALAALVLTKGGLFAGGGIMLAVGLFLAVTLGSQMLGLGDSAPALGSEMSANDQNLSEFPGHDFGDALPTR